MNRPLLLDVFCGAGGSAVGYHRAGFDVVGVDIAAQPHYPFGFVQADGIDVLDQLVARRGARRRFAAVHVSMPCQDWSLLHRNYGAPEHGTGDLLLQALERLHHLDIPWVCENVEGAPLPTAITLCGASFGLGASGLDLSRHRLFECSFPILAPPCQHRRGHTIGVYGNGTNAWHLKKLGRCLRVAEMREAMGIDWMTRAELSQAIPPAYTEFVGGQLLASIEGVAA